MNLLFKKQVIESTLVLYNLKGKILTSDDTTDISEEIEGLISENKLKVILDLTQLEYINSTGLNFIISTFTKLRNAGGELVICNISKKVEDLLVITKLNSIFNICDNLEQAKEVLLEKKKANQ